MYNNKSIKLGKIKTSKTELVDILKAWLVLSLAFTFVLSSISLLDGNFSQILSFQTIIVFIISALTAGIGFLLHELAHKFMAQKYGCTAEFRAFDQMLYLALGLAALVGFIFAAPGAVMISGMITRKENGIISLVGPLTNYVLGIIFLLLQSLPVNFLFSFAFSIGFSVNMWLGLFNMIPFGPLDGVKVLNWNKVIWGIMVVAGIFFVFGLPRVF